MVYSHHGVTCGCGPVEPMMSLITSHPDSIRRFLAAQPNAPSTNELCVTSTIETLFVNNWKGNRGMMQKSQNTNTERGNSTVKKNDA